MMTAGQPAAQILRRLRLVRWVALLDLVLLIALVSSSLSGNREFVRVLGPLHGGNFLLLLVIVATAAADGFWGWWFPALILVSAGPPGALVGEWVIGRRLAAHDIVTEHDANPADAGTGGESGSAMPGVAGATGAAPGTREEGR
jgi:hypothetical protein